MGLMVRWGTALDAIWEALVHDRNGNGAITPRTIDPSIDLDCIANVSRSATGNTERTNSLR